MENKVHTFRLPENLWIRLYWLSKATNVNKSQIVREAITDYLNKKENENG